jgi:hypothetical protein
MDDDSFIGVDNGECRSFVGPDAVNYVRAVYLANSLKLYAKAKIIPTRGVTATKMLAMATGYSGKAYKRGQYVEAANDVQKWADEMKAALPTVES